MTDKTPDRFYELEAWCNQQAAEIERLLTGLRRAASIDPNSAANYPYRDAFYAVKGVIRATLEGADEQQAGTKAEG